MDFFRTGLGKQFFSRHIPEFIKQLRDLNENVKDLNTTLSKNKKIWTVVEVNAHRTVHVFTEEEAARSLEEKIKKELDSTFQGHSPSTLYPIVKSFDLQNENAIEKIGTEEWANSYNPK